MVIHKAFAFNVIFKGCVGSWLVLGFQIYKLVMNNITATRNFIESNCNGIDFITKSI